METAIVGFLVIGVSGGTVLFALGIWGNKLHKKSHHQDRPQRRRS